MNNEDQKALDAWILRNDAEAMQTGKVTTDLRNYWAAREPIPLPSKRQQQSGPRYTVEETRAIQRQQKIDAVEKQQLADIAERNRVSNLTVEQREAEETLQAAIMLEELVDSQIAFSRSRNQRGRLEVLELKKEQRAAERAAAERNVVAANARAANSAILADSPDLAYARTSARIEVDNAEPGSDERIRASIYLNALNNVTAPAEARSLIKDFHTWEATQLQARRNALLEAEHAAIVEANPAVQRAHELGKQAAEAGLQQLEAQRRADGGNE